MKKWILTLLLPIFLFTACSTSGIQASSKYFSSPSQKNEGITNVLNALQAGDKEAVKSMFSVNAIAEAENFDAQLDALFLFFEGNVQFWKERGSSEHASKDHGQIVNDMQAWYQVDTEDQSYLFILIECKKDTENPDNIGISTLRVFYAEDKEIYFPSWEVVEVSGIFTPNYESPTPENSEKEGEGQEDKAKVVEYTVV